MVDDSRDKVAQSEMDARSDVAGHEMEVGSAIAEVSDDFASTWCRRIGGVALGFLRAF